MSRRRGKQHLTRGRYGAIQRVHTVRHPGLLMVEHDDGAVSLAPGVDIGVAMYHLGAGTLDKLTGDPNGSRILAAVIAENLRTVSAAEILTKALDLGHPIGEAERMAVDHDLATWSVEMLITSCRDLVAAGVLTPSGLGPTRR